MDNDPKPGEGVLCCDWCGADLPENDVQVVDGVEAIVCPKCKEQSDKAESA